MQAPLSRQPSYSFHPLGTPLEATSPPVHPLPSIFSMHPLSGSPPSEYTLFLALSSRKPHLCNSPGIPRGFNPKTFSFRTLTNLLYEHPPHLTQRHLLLGTISHRFTPLGNLLKATRPVPRHRGVLLEASPSGSPPPTPCQAPSYKKLFPEPSSSYHSQGSPPRHRLLDLILSVNPFSSTTKPPFFMLLPSRDHALLQTLPLSK